jgi:hypothetical protein
MKTYAAGDEITRLEAERRRLKLSFAKLGDALGVSESAASRYCKPRSHPLHRQPSRKGKDGATAPAELLRQLTGNRVHLGNYADPVAAKRARRG